MARIRPAVIAAACAVLAACASPPAVQPEVFDRAGQAVGQALAERGTASKSVDAALIPPLTVDMPKTGDEQRFDLSVINAPAAQVFMALVTGTRYNMLVTPEVAGTITVKLKDVTVKEALESIRELYGYEFIIKGNRISIQPNTLQTRVFQVNYLASRRQGNSELRVTSSAIAGNLPTTGTTSAAGTTTPLPGGTGTGTTSTTTTMGNVTSRVQTSTDSDFWGNLTTAIRTLVGSGEDRSVVVSPQSGVIVIRALPREIRAVENYLKATQTVVERQVMLEAKIVDVTLSDEFQSGVNWAGFRSGGSASKLAFGVSGANATLNTTNGTAARTLGTTGTSTITPGQAGSIVATALGKGFFGLAFQTANFAALMNFLETQGSVSVLSSPRIATINNQKAVLKVGTDELFVTNVTTTTTSTTAGSVSTPSLTLQPYFSGISLDVTPQIDEDDNIILHVHPAVSVVTEKTKQIDLGATLGQFTLPLASSSVNETDSIVRVKDGNIVAIGGLMRQEQTSTTTQLPGAGKAGTLSPLLGQKGNALSKRELVILLKPTIIHDDRSWVKDLEQTGERIRALDPRQLAREE